jgi:prepilin-type N-terminal cleavage/methylation domain-containing protein
MNHFKRKNMKNNKGFTLVELLVVIAVIALIGVFAAVAVNSARSKQRDATRLSSVRQVQSALEDYFNENNSYPDGELLPLGDSTQSACLGSLGFAGDCSGDDAVVMRIVPSTYESGLGDIVTCGDPVRRAFCYTMLSDGASYVIHFELENGLSAVGLEDGVNCATPDGMEAGVCSAS